MVVMGKKCMIFFNCWYWYLRKTSVRAYGWWFGESYL